MADLPRPALQVVEPEPEILDDPLMTDEDRAVLSRISDSVSRRVYWITHLRPVRDRAKGKEVRHG